MLIRQRGKIKNCRDSNPCSNFQNVNEKRSAAAKRHWVIGKTVELNQPVCCKDMLALEWKPAKVLCWG